jgi:hypothetical protein
MKLYMFRTVPLSIIRSLFTAHSAMVYVMQVCRQLSSRTRMELQFYPGPAGKLGGYRQRLKSLSVTSKNSAFSDTIYVCSLWLSHSTEIISLYGILRLILVGDTHSVLCYVVNEYLRIILMNVSIYCSQLEQVFKVRPNINRILPVVSKGRVYVDKRLFSHGIWTDILKNTAILSIPFFKAMSAPDNEHGVPLIPFTVSRYMQHLV